MDKKLKLHDKVFKPFIPNERIESAVDAVAEKINADFHDSPKVPVLLCVLNGSILFTAGLMKRLDFDIDLMSIKLSSYQGTSSTGQIRQDMGLTGDVTGKDVIIVEDIVDTGRTIEALVKILYDRGAAINKTMPRLLELSRSAQVVLTGPSVSCCPELLALGIDRMHGRVITEPEPMLQMIRQKRLSVNPWSEGFCIRAT